MEDGGAPYGGRRSGGWSERKSGSAAASAGSAGVGLLRGRDEAERRNQGDKRRVGPVMYDAQIRAIVPITVQIIAHELVASGVAATPSNRLRRRRMPGSPFGYGLVDDPPVMSTGMQPGIGGG